jgi:NAD(P)-dependent dehydrogenase (short-subunit alcohol dehydrogenase family)
LHERVRVTAAPVVLLTGASRGIGAQTAHWLADGGAQLALVARDARALSLVGAEARSHGVEVLELACDVTEEGAPDRMVAAVLDRFGRLDSLVNNAGIAGPVGHLTTIDLHEWRSTLETNLLAPVALIQAAAMALRSQRGRVINVTSEVADSPSESIAPYAGAKAALRHLSLTLAREEPELVCVAYDPGPCDTDLMAEIRSQAIATMRPDLAAAYHDLYESGRLVRPLDTGRILAWLASSVPREWSGRVIDYTDDEAVRAARHAFP